jgi:two-component system heavy metal sensor histidine kinase CusS
MQLSIRWRLTLWNTLGLSVVLLGFGILVYALLARALYQRVDRSLLSELQELEQDQRMATQRDERLRHWIYEFKEHENISCVAYNASGQVRERTVELAADSVPPAPEVTGDERRFSNMSLPIIGRQRALVSRLRLGDEDFIILFLAPLEDVDRELDQLLAALATAGPLIVILAGVLANGLARKALAPVEQLHRLTQDITAERLDRRLPVGNQHDELGRLAQTINAMIARLERSFDEIRRFTADASHELRTPLTAIRTEAEVALARPLAPTEHQQLLGSILEECGRLTRLTDQLLSLAREDAQVTAPATQNGQAQDLVDLKALVASVAETIRPLADSKGLRLHTAASSHDDGAMIVRGDAGRLREVFFNLLDNSIKYTPQGGEVEVRIGRNGSEALITVRDTGIGIAAEHVPRVFDRFYRVDKARSRAEGGTGLGLSIARSIVAAHGGQIELVSSLDHGTTCTVRLPIESKLSKKPEGQEA